MDFLRKIPRVDKNGFQLRNKIWMENICPFIERSDAPWVRQIGEEGGKRPEKEEDKVKKPTRWEKSVTSNFVSDCDGCVVQNQNYQVISVKSNVTISLTPENSPVSSRQTSSEVNFGPRLHTKVNIIGHPTFSPASSVEIMAMSGGRRCARLYIELTIHALGRLEEEEDR